MTKLHLRAFAPALALTALLAVSACSTTPLRGATSCCAGMKCEKNCCCKGESAACCKDGGCACCASCGDNGGKRGCAVGEKSK